MCRNSTVTPRRHHWINSQTNAESARAVGGLLGPSAKVGMWEFRRGSGEG
jgi:hypothetical protein